MYIIFRNTVCEAPKTGPMCTSRKRGSTACAYHHLHDECSEGGQRQVPAGIRRGEEEKEESSGRSGGCS